MAAAAKPDIRSRALPHRFSPPRRSRPCPCPRCPPFASGSRVRALRSFGCGANCWRRRRAGATPFSFRRADRPKPASARLPPTPKPPEPDPVLAELDYEDYHSPPPPAPQSPFGPTARLCQRQRPAGQVQPFHPAGMFDPAVSLARGSRGHGAPLSFARCEFRYGAHVVEFAEDFTLPGVAGIKLTWPLTQSDPAGRGDLLPRRPAISARSARATATAFSARGLARFGWAADAEEYSAFFGILGRAPGGRGRRRFTVCASLDFARVRRRYAVRHSARSHHGGGGHGAAVLSRYRHPARHRARLVSMFCSAA